MTEVWRNKDRYDPSRSLGAWVLGIANKRAIDHVRRRRRTAVPGEELYGIARTTDLQSGRQRTNWLWWRTVVDPRLCWEHVYRRIDCGSGQESAA